MDKRFAIILSLVVPGCTVICIEGSDRVSINVDKTGTETEVDTDTLVEKIEERE